MICGQMIVMVYMLRLWNCQLCGNEYPYKEGKLKLCRKCATEKMVKEARVVRHAIYWAKGDHPATLTLKQWIGCLDYFEWMCAYCQQRPYEVLEHFIPMILEERAKPLCKLIGGTSIYNCIPACHWCNTRKHRVSPEYIWKISDGVEQGMFPSLAMLERVAFYLQIDLS